MGRVAGSSAPWRMASPSMALPPIRTGIPCFVGEIKNGVLVFGFEYTLAKKFVYFGPFNHFNFSDGPCFRYVPDSNSVVFGATQQGQLASGPYLLFLHEKRTINLQEGKFKNDGTFGYDLIRPLHNPYPFLDEDFFSWKAEVASGDPLTAALSEEGELKVKMIHVNSVATGFPEGIGLSPSNNLGWREDFDFRELRRRGPGWLLLFQDHRS
jgi:hypothetical protein